MESVLKAPAVRPAARPASPVRFPKTIEHWNGKPAYLDSTLLMLSLRLPMGRASLEKTLKEAKLQFVKIPRPGISLEPKEDDRPVPGKQLQIPLETPVLNEGPTGYFLESPDEKPIGDAELDRLRAILGEKIEWTAPIYRQDKGGSRNRFEGCFCAFPRTLLVELKKGVDPKQVDAELKPEKLHIDWNYRHSTLFYLRFTGAPTENVYELKSRLAEKYPSLIQSVGFENMPMLNPQQGRLWNHVRIQSKDLTAVAAGSEVKVAVIDHGIQFNNALTGGLRYGGSWNAGTFVDDPNFSDYHGTCCAGIIADLSGQFSVTAGPASYPILSLITPNFSDGQLATAIYYAVDNGCSVISISLNQEGAWSKTTLDPALSYAETHGCVICMSSGNGNQDYLAYPADVPTVMVVGATDRSDNRADFSDWGSSYGPNLAVCAPGIRIGTTDLFGDEGFNTEEDRWGAYTMLFYGTSAAAPHVAAVAAMIIKKYRAQNADASPHASYVRDRIKGSAIKVGPGAPYNGGFSTTHGYGLLNAAAALNF
jgi:hypothetical protein